MPARRATSSRVRSSLSRASRHLVISEDGSRHQMPSQVITRHEVPIAGPSARNDYASVPQLGEMIRSAREDLGWSQRELAARLSGGAEGNTISRYERGEIRPQRRRMAEIIGLLDLDEDVALLAWARWTPASPPRAAAPVGDLDRARDLKDLRGAEADADELADLADERDDEEDQRKRGRR